MKHDARKHTRVLAIPNQQLSMSLPPPVSKPERAQLQKKAWIDVSEVALGTGLHGKVVISIALSDALTPTPRENDSDYDQRLWDALWLAHLQLSLSQSSAATFNFSFPRKHCRAGESSEINLRLHAAVQDKLTTVGLLEDF